MRPSEALEAGLVLLGPNGENWYDGKKHPSGRESECCAQTCVLRVGNFGKEGYKALGFLQLAIGATDSHEDMTKIWAWNDAKGRTFAEVKDKFEEAIVLAKNEETA